ncbi:unnamed protein product, partial [Meganyctiphanes norvegica]
SYCSAGEQTLCTINLQSNNGVMKVLQGFLMLFILHGSSSIICYHCDNYNPSTIIYDTDCGNDNYDGNLKIDDRRDSCAIRIQDGNLVYRYPENGGTDGDCVYGAWGDVVGCICTSELCNNHLCEHCTGP